MKILIADDEKDIRNLIKLYLANEQCEMIEASNGQEVLERIDDTIDLVLLDIMMPQLDGIQTCIEIRKKYMTPIIFLSAKSEELDQYIGFSSGADDYITKPFNPLDLTSRIKAHTRRFRMFNTNLIQEDVIRIHDFVVDFKSKTITKNNNEIKCTKIEFEILKLFLKNRKRVFSLEQIYELVWHENCVMNAQSTVSVHIRNLRTKIEDDLTNPKIIKTVWGSGYRVD